MVSDKRLTFMDSNTPGRVHFKYFMYFYHSYYFIMSLGLLSLLLALPRSEVEDSCFINELL
jgi:hypothetical protein